MDLPSSSFVASISEIAEIQRTYAAVEKFFASPCQRAIVVSSAVVGEGKTLTASGLATVAAHQNNKRVLVADLNWYRPALHSVFELAQPFGIEHLWKCRSIKELTQKSKTDHLDVLVAPRPETRSGITTHRLNLLAEKVVEQARETYDLSVIDTSAMYPTNRHMVDPAVFSKKADGVVMVVLTHSTNRKHVKRALMALETSGANVLGVVVNQCERIAEGKGAESANLPRSV